LQTLVLLDNLAENAESRMYDGLVSAAEPTS
jgi:hypothetical protein